MLAEKKTATNIGVGLGILLQVAGRVVGATPEGGFTPVGSLLLIAGAGCFIWGCMNYAEGKGHSKWLGLLGFLSCLGLIILVLMPDRHKEG